MNKDSKISIITICYNERERIEKTIQSVFNQLYKNIEYIVIDGGSSDGTLEILDQYSEKIDVLISEKDDGIYHAMNKGGSYASGDYLLFLNGGDKLADNTVLRRVTSYDSKADIIHGYMETPEGKAIKRLGNIDINKYLQNSTLPHQATFIEKKIFDEVDGYDESFKIAGDYDFFVRAVYNTNVTVQYIPELISVFYLDGLANSNPDIRDAEKKKVQGNIKSGIRTIFKKKLKWLLPI